MLMTSPFFTLEILKSPSSPVIVPLVVPFTTTEAPIIVSPFWSTTIPVHALFCCTLCTPMASTCGAACMNPVEIPDKNSNALTDFSCSLVIDLSFVLIKDLVYILSLWLNSSFCISRFPLFPEVLLQTSCILL